jgi:hypothetical protein
MLVIVITSSYFANDVLSFNVESVQFDQAINAVLSLEELAKNMMFKPLSTGTVQTSFVTTSPYVIEEGNLTILIGGNKVASMPVNGFKVKGGERVGVSTQYYYIGNSPLLLVGLNGSISCVKKYQDQGAWVSLDYGRIRCVYCGEMNYYNGTNPQPIKRNLLEMTAVNLTSDEISPSENSRIILENMGIQTQQIEKPSGNFTITVQLSDDMDSVSLRSLGGNVTLPTVINLTIIKFKITVLGGG